MTTVPVKFEIYDSVDDLFATLEAFDEECMSLTVKSKLIHDDEELESFFVELKKCLLLNRGTIK